MVAVSRFDLKARILKILEIKNHTYEELAEYVGMTPAELDKAFENNSLEVRMLEQVSKELRIPLYSFFRDESITFDFGKVSYYNTDIWSDNEKLLKAEIRSLRSEIENLRRQLSEKDSAIKQLQGK